MTLDLTLNSIRRRHGRVIRAVAILFLLYTGGDILLPQYFCRGEEIGGLPLSTSVVIDKKSADTHQAFNVSSNPTRPDEPHEQAPHTEDCFCCCAHVLPSFGISGSVNYESSQSANNSEMNSLPSPPLPHTYRPPRFA